MTATLDMAAATDRGRVRAHNEDCVAADPQTGLALVADGMGGHNAGEVASRMAVEIIVEGLQAAVADFGARAETGRAEALIAELIERANRTITDCGRARTDYAGMGTTVVLGLWYGRNLTVGHVGDSRLYRLRAGRLEQLTRDHTLVQEQVDLGWLTPDAARGAANRAILTRAVGSELRVPADLATHDTAPGDIYLLCSDGLTEMLPDDEIRDVLVRDESRIQQAADDLVRRANENGGVDNISVVLVRVADQAAPESGQDS